MTGIVNNVIEQAAAGGLEPAAGGEGGGMADGSMSRQ